MEDVLSVYQRPYDPLYPMICFDESIRTLFLEKREPLPMRRGAPHRFDYSYEPAGSNKLLLACEPLRGCRVVQVTQQRRKREWALFMRDLIDIHYPEAHKLVLVMDQLNTHTPSAFYEVFSPQEARRLTEKLEIHYTPKHGSWLNMAEIEFSALSRALSRRIGSQQELEQEIAAWRGQRNAMEVTIDWQFRAPDARLKLRHLYPKVEEVTSSTL